MATPQTRKTTRAGKRWRRLRLACWGLLLLWFAWFAYVRITTPPAALTRAAQPGDEQPRSIDDELFETIQELPLVPAAKPPRMRGWWWGSDILVAALPGDWSPDPNTSQAVAIDYVNKSSTHEVLDRIVALCAARRETLGTIDSPRRSPVPSQPALLMTNKPQDTVAALAFRARYRATDKQDLAGALADLRAAADVALSLPRQGPRALYYMYAFSQVPSLVDYELGCLAQEADVPPALARETIAFLKDGLSLSVADEVIRAVQADQQIDRLLDRYYTDDGHGDGWLVLSAASDLFTLGLGPRPTERTRLWNVFSPLFSGRKTVRAKLTSQTDDFRQLDGRDFDAARRFLASRSRSQHGGSVLDGPVFELTQGIEEYKFNAVFRRVTLRRALVVMLALSAYKHDHAEYPDTLDALAPAYLADVPLDAFTQRPFRYQKTSEATYELGPARQLPDELHQYWWMSELGYGADSYLPQRSPEKP